MSERSSDRHPDLDPEPGTRSFHTAVDNGFRENSPARGPFGEAKRLIYETLTAKIGDCKIELSFYADKDDRLSAWHFTVAHPIASVTGEAKNQSTAEERAIKAAHWLNSGAIL